MTQTQNRIVVLTMKLDLKAREYKELCLELDKIKNEEQVSNEELLELKNKFQKNHDEIVEINKELRELKEKNNDIEDSSFKEKDLFNRNKKFNVCKEDNKELVVEKEKSIIKKLVENLKSFFKKFKRYKIINKKKMY